MVFAGTLSYALYRARTGYHRTDSVICRLICGAVQTGLFACIFAMGHLTAFLSRLEFPYFSFLGELMLRVVSPDTLVYAFFAGSTGRMYSIVSEDTLEKSSRLTQIHFKDPDGYFALSQPTTRSAVRDYGCMSGTVFVRILSDDLL